MLSNKNIKDRKFAVLYILIVIIYRLIVLESCLIRNSQLLATLCAASSQHLAAIRSSHTSAETVLVNALAARWLVSSFHCHNSIVFFIVLLSNYAHNVPMRGAKVQPFFKFAKPFNKKSFLSVNFTHFFGLRNAHIGLLCCAFAPSQCAKFPR